MHIRSLIYTCAANLQARDFKLLEVPCNCINGMTAHTYVPGVLMQLPTEFHDSCYAHANCWKSAPVKRKTLRRMIYMKISYLNISYHNFLFGPLQIIVTILSGSRHDISSILLSLSLSLCFSSNAPFRKDYSDCRCEWEKMSRHLLSKA